MQSMVASALATTHVGNTETNMLGNKSLSRSTATCWRHVKTVGQYVSIPSVDERKLWRYAGNPTQTHTNSDGSQIVNTTLPTGTKREHWVNKRPDNTSYRMLWGTLLSLGTSTNPPPHVYYKKKTDLRDAWREVAEILHVPRDEVEKN